MAGRARRPTNATVALAVLTLIYAFNFMDRQILSVLAEPIKRDLHLSDTELGLLGGFMFALFYTSFGVPVAWLADRTKRVGVLAGACALWSVFCALCGVATGFSTLAMARIGVAVGEAGGVPPSYSIIADLFPKERRGRAMAIYSLGSPIGLGLGTALGAWVAATWGWRAAFFVVALPGLLLSGLLVLLVREPVRGGFEPAGSAAVEPAPPLLVAIRDFIRNPALVATAVAGAFGGFVCYALMAWIAAYMIRILGMTLGEVARWLSLTLAVSLGLGIWISGWLADRFGPADIRAYLWVPGGAMLVGLPAYLLAMAMTDWHFALVLFAVPLGLSIFYLAPVAAVVQTLVPPARRSTASALVLLFLNLFGLGLGPVVVGMVSDHAVPAMGGRSLVAGMYALVPMFAAAAVANFVAAGIVGRTAGNRLAGGTAAGTDRRAATR